MVSLKRSMVRKREEPGTRADENPQFESGLRPRQSGISSTLNLLQYVLYRTEAGFVKHYVEPSPSRHVSATRRSDQNTVRKSCRHSGFS